MLNAWTSVLISPEFLWSWMALALVIAAVLTKLSAPYGRHARQGWGVALPARWSWMVMEAVSLLAFMVCFLSSPHRSWSAWLFVAVYAIHYGYRSFLYPFMGSASAAAVPISVSLMAVVFNAFNGSILGGALYWSSAGPPEPTYRFALGLILVIVGFYTHVRSDAILRNLRKVNGPGYHVPDGFLFRFVSCPNYLGELVQWCGFAVMVGHLGGWTFAFWSAANLVPRAIDHHRWYLSRFDDYPIKRKALLPGLL